MRLAIKFSLSLLSIFLRSRNAKNRLEDKIYAFGLFYLSDLDCWRSITIGSLNALRWCLSKDDYALVIKKDGEGYSFGLEAFTKRKSMLVLSSLGAENYKSPQINSISWLLRLLLILSILFSTPIC